MKLADTVRSKLAKLSDQTGQRSSKASSTEIGDQAESLCKDFLKQKGLSFVARNFSCKHGEIDLIMQREQQYIFVEVRYRKSAMFGSGSASVTAAKQRKLARSAPAFLRSIGLSATTTPYRIDVIEASPDKRRDETAILDEDHNYFRQHRIRWIKNAICLF